MESELHALILAFDHAFVIANLLHDALARKITIEAMVDSRTVFDVVAKHGKTAERDCRLIFTSCERATNTANSQE